MSRNQTVLLIALGIDNFGSGLFLPLAIVYATQVVGLPVGQAGAVIAVGTGAGLLVPPLAGRLTDRSGPRAVVVLAQVVQAAGAATYVVADGAGLVLCGAVLLAAGQQMFYSAVFALIADVAGDGSKDHAFTVAGMVRGAAFGLGGLLVGGLLSGAGQASLRIAVAADAVTFVVAALLLVLFLHLPSVRPEATPAGPSGVLRDRPYLLLIVISVLFALPVDVFLVGVPVYLLDVLHSPAWLPGGVLAVLTIVSSVAGTIVLRATRHLSRTAAIGWGAWIYTGWCLAMIAVLSLPAAWHTGYLLVLTVIFAAGNLAVGARANALAEAAAPRTHRGRYLAAYQYAFTAAGVLAPAVVALISVAPWLPWLVVAAGVFVAARALRWLAPRLPQHALTEQAG
ncbi:MFS transporter [Pseudonocardiaceae bacterium YIM PH 21723]|nr:MFS transporter [Pseudonocardiaceae bacterium YIM PH 21723]